MGLLDGTLQQKIQRLEKLTSPSQNPKPSKKAIDELRRNIRMSASASNAKKKKPVAKKVAKKTDPEKPYYSKPTPGKPGWNMAKKSKRIKKSDLKKRYA